MNNYIGIEFGGTKIQVVLGTRDGKIKQRFRYNVDKVAGADGICRNIEKAIAEILTTGNPVALGAGFGGPLNPARDTITRSYHVSGWDGFPLKAWLHKISGLPVIIDNDANVAGLAEAVLGAGRGQSPVFYVTLGSGVGGGLIINQSIFHGAGRTEAEIGHLRFNQTGSIVEEHCSGWAADKKIRAFIEANPKSRLAGIPDEVEARKLGTALAEQDEDARLLLKEIASDIAYSLSHVVHLMSPAVIVLGGGLSRLGDPLKESIRQELKQYLMDALQPGPEIAIATLGEDVVPCGALLLAQQLVL